MKISPEHFGLLTDEVKRGIGSETLLRTLGPLYQDQLESLLNALEQAPANLEALLDLRAKITVIRYLQRELIRTAAVGIEAREKLDQLS